VAATIESYVSVLLRVLGDRRLILTEPGGYRLAAETLEIDADRFEAPMRAAAERDGNDRRAALESATALGREDLACFRPAANRTSTTRAGNWWRALGRACSRCTILRAELVDREHRRHPLRDDPRTRAF
jgi:hypothetical protein